MALALLKKSIQIKISYNVIIPKATKNLAMSSILIFRRDFSIH